MSKLTCTLIVAASILLLPGHVLAQEEKPASLPAVNMLLLADSQSFESGYPAPVPKTGQTKCWSEVGGEIPCIGTGQDGAQQKGVAWPNPRFTNNNNGTVTDNLTGLVWLRHANCVEFFFGDGTNQNHRSWSEAFIAANNLSSGYCGLSDGSIAGQWRLPNLRELLSLVDYGNMSPALPTPHPFLGSLTAWYWSSTTSPGAPVAAWRVGFSTGSVSEGYKGENLNVLAVRGGQ